MQRNTLDKYFPNTGEGKKVKGIARKKNIWGGPINLDHCIIGSVAKTNKPSKVGVMSRFL